MRGTVLRSARIVEETRLRRRGQRWYTGRTLRVRSQEVLWNGLSDEEEDLPSPTGRSFRGRTVGRLDRPGSVRSSTIGNSGSETLGE
jgi:hypothetical protein